MEARLNQSRGVNRNVIGTKYKAQSNLWSTEKFWNHRRSIAPSSTRLYWSGAVKINLDIHRSTTLPVFSPDSWVYRDCWVSKYMHSTVLYLISNLAHTQNAWFEEIGGFGNKYLPGLSMYCGCFSFGVFSFNLQTSKQFYTFHIRRNVT